MGSDGLLDFSETIQENYSESSRVGGRSHALHQVEVSLDLLSAITLG